jgi:hypothetical protein
MKLFYVKRGLILKILRVDWTPFMNSQNKQRFEPYATLRV